MPIRARYLLVLTILLLAGLALGELHYTAPRLPETVASHFGHSGQADAWMSRAELIAASHLPILIMPALFLGIYFLVPLFPRALIHFPSQAMKDYWLAPERRKRFNALLQTYVAATGVAGVAFVVWLNHQVLRLNVLGKPRLEHMWTALGLLLLTILALSVHMHRQMKVMGLGTAAK